MEPDRILLLDFLRKAFPHLIEEQGSEGGVNGLFARAHWNALLGCWLTTGWGMVIGIETDGHVHT